MTNEEMDVIVLPDVGCPEGWVPEADDPKAAVARAVVKYLDVHKEVSETEIDLLDPKHAAARDIVVELRDTPDIMFDALGGYIGEDLIKVIGVTVYSRPIARN